MNADQFVRQTEVSRETFSRFQTWYDLLSHWNKRINLVSPATLHDFWLRHALDSWQIVGLLKPNTKTVLDMGAGAGFPGLALAIGLMEQNGGIDSEGASAEGSSAEVTLVESNGKKCNFLRTVIRELSLPAKVVNDRIETLPPEPFDVITARAFAPLPKLMAYSLPFFGQESFALFPKGANWQAEVSAAKQDFEFDLSTTPSQTDEVAQILHITNLREKSSNG